MTRDEALAVLGIMNGATSGFLTARLMTMFTRVFPHFRMMVDAVWDTRLGMVNMNALPSDELTGSHHDPWREQPPMTQEEARKVIDIFRQAVWLGVSHANGFLRAFAEDFPVHGHLAEAVADTEEASQ